ncbi:MAG TPA: efflux RND transporter periplasmic adaptor subunit [Candidatus Brocadiia bacterium]|nr:efflux RND transporter periplasmic adaptor subunit [Candidatus Brocadiia bacterium]
MRTWIALALLAGLAVAAVSAPKWYQQKTEGGAVAYKTATVERGSLVVTIDATGTLEPEEIVDVGAQISGQIVAIGADAGGNVIDYTSRVEKDALLARIDDALYQADVAEAEAKLRSAKAAVARNEADLVQLKAKLELAEKDWARAQKIGPSEALSQASYDSYKSAAEVAKASVTIGQAALEESKAAVTQCETALWRAKRNLGYCAITSPVTGVVIDRRVNIGQTVAASLNTPSLFLIAKDLTRMQIWASVNEADIGKIKPGLPVAFTVDAFPGDTFHGTVQRVRLNASMTQNVVTYVVEVAVDNPGGKLLPYLTASVKFEASRADNALLVPNAALRWQPEASMIAPGAAAPKTAKDPSKKAVVWVSDGRYVRPVPVTVGISDGVTTAVSSDELTEGVQVVTGATAAASAGPASAAKTAPAASAATQGETNPFLPKMPARPKNAPHGPPPM